MKRISIFSIILAILLVACQDAYTPTPTILTPTSTARPVTQTNSPTVQVPTQTKIPTFTKVPTFTPKPTLNPLEMAEKVLTGLSIDETHAYSPDGNCEWKRILAWPSYNKSAYDTEGNFFTYVTVNCGNQDPWVVVNLWSPASLGYSIPELIGWSTDGKHLFFVDRGIPDGCQPPGGLQENIHRVSLTDGGILTIPLAWAEGMTLSPDTTKVIYVDLQYANIGIYDFITSTEQRISFDVPESIEYWYTSKFTWAPDEQSALFIVQYGDACFPSGVSLRWVDFAAQQVITLLEREQQTLSIIGWTENSQVKISIDHQDYWLDPVSGTVTPISNTPN